SSGAHPSAAAVALAIRRACSRPEAPVAALALPLFRITAAARPPEAARCSRLTTTGAAVILLEVKTPAALTGRPSAVATRARSGAPDALTPHAPPAAAKPRAAVTLTGRPRRPAGRWSPATRGPGWRTAPPGRRRPSPGCRAR